MPTLTPTADAGTRAIARDMTVVDPSRQMPEAERQSFLAGTGLNGAFIADLLSDMLAHERATTHLYRSVAGRTHNPMLEQRYQRFGQEMLEHVTTLEDLVRELGGDPLYVSPPARATEKAGMCLLESTFMLSGSVDLMTQELVMLDAVMLAEAKSHANWATLGKLAEKFPEGPARDAVTQAVGRVQPQADEHDGWVQDMRQKMIGAQASSSVFATIGTKAEEMIARIRGWLG